MDCMAFMATCKDKEFDLAIVDPPYGISYEDGGQYFNSKYGAKNWDSQIPPLIYFQELMRVSNNQIIIMNDKFLCSGIDLIAPQRMSFNRKGSSFNITTTHIKKLVIEKIK